MDKYTIRWTDQAILSLKRIHDFVSIQSGQAYGKKLVKQLFDLSKTLASLP